MKVLELTDRAVSENSIAAKRCFACGGSSSSGSGEHVIPKWLQHECRLFDERLTLLNGTYIPYRNLTVPCCIDCNTGFLSNIESTVQPLLRSIRRGEARAGALAFQDIAGDIGQRDKSLVRPFTARSRLDRRFGDDRQSSPRSLRAAECAKAHLVHLSSP
jgi:hypothetical protein